MHIKFNPLSENDQIYTNMADLSFSWLQTLEKSWVREKTITNTSTITRDRCAEFVCAKAAWHVNADLLTYIIIVA